MVATLRWYRTESLNGLGNIRNQISNKSFRRVNSNVTVSVIVVHRQILIFEIHYKNKNFYEKLFCFKSFSRTSPPFLLFPPPIPLPNR